MKISKTSLNNIIKEEVQLFLEACGCGGGPPEAGMSDPMVIPLESLPLEDHGEEDDVGELSKHDALELISLIASKTSCPITRQALMDIVQDLGDDDGNTSVYDLEMPEDDGEAWASGDIARVQDVGSLDPHSAFGLGHGIGSGHVTDYEVGG